MLGNSEVRAACIDDGGPFLLFDEVKFVTIVEHIPTFKSPLFNRVHPLRPICHGLNLLETTHAANNLVLIETTKDSI